MFYTYNYFRQYNNMEPIEDYKAFYRKFSNDREFGADYSNYDHLVKTRLIGDHGAIFNAILRKHPESILDIGCGNGINLPFSRLFPNIDYHGLDYAERSAEMARVEFPAATIHVGDAFDLPFEDDRFDMIIMANFIILYRSADDRRALLQEAFRVLRPGGVLLLLVWNDAPCLRWSIRLSRLVARCCGTALPQDFMGIHFSRRDILETTEPLGFREEERILLGNDYGVMESIRYLSMERYRRVFGKSESDAFAEIPQNVYHDLKKHAKGASWLTALLFGLSRLNDRLFSMYALHIFKKGV